MTFVLSFVPLDQQGEQQCCASCYGANRCSWSGAPKRLGHKDRFWRFFLEKVYTEGNGSGHSQLFTRQPDGRERGHCHSCGGIGVLSGRRPQRAPKRYPESIPQRSAVRTASLRRGRGALPELCSSAQHLTFPPPIGIVFGVVRRSRDAGW